MPLRNINDGVHLVGFVKGLFVHIHIKDSAFPLDCAPPTE